MQLQIDERVIGVGQPCFVIAEVGLAHDGSYGQAHAYIDACAATGVDAVKFQCHTGDRNEQWRVKPAWSDESRLDYWVRTGFEPQEWRGLLQHCRDAKVEFLCSPFSLAAAEMMDPMLRLWKVPSGRITDTALLEYIAKTKKPVLLSTGMGTDEEIAAAMEALADCPVGLLQCTTLYPCPPSLIGLSFVCDYGGLSDHSGTIYPGIAAAALGCEALEVHVTFSRESSGFDNAASLTISELRQLVRGIRFVEQAMQPLDKTDMAGKLADHRRLFMHI